MGELRWTLLLLRDFALCVWAAHRTLGWSWRKCIACTWQGHWGMWRLRRAWRKGEHHV